jgi:hypothetical protein
VAHQDTLTQALRDARLAEAARIDAIASIRDAKSLRLHALKLDLDPVLAPHPDAVSLFELNVQPGENPRLWVDLITSVVMEPDPQTYRLVQDRNQSREVVFETRNHQAMVTQMTRYFAHRMVERDRERAAASAKAIDSRHRYTKGEITYVWFTGLTLGVCALLILAMLLGKLHF